MKQILWMVMFWLMLASAQAASFDYGKVQSKVNEEEKHCLLTELHWLKHIRNIYEKDNGVFKIGVGLEIWNGARCAVLFGRWKLEAANDTEGRMAA